MRPVFLPILEANMTHGVIRAWLKREGEAVQAGEPLFEVETDKVNAEVEAEASGIVRHIAVPVGTKVPVLGILAFIGAADEAVPPPDTWSALVRPAAPAGLEASLPASVEPPSTPAPTAASRSAGNRTAASPAARRLARERGMVLDRIRGTGPRGEVTRADVEAAVTATAPAAVTSAGGSGRIDPGFVRLLRSDAAAFRSLSSDAKVQLYRRHGAQIGEQVRIGAGAIIIAPEIVIDAGATIGAESSIECERLQLGRLSAFGTRTRVRCRSVEIGDALWSKEDVVIGGGGSEEPGARLRAGDACFFGEGAYLNTCHPLTLGDEVCIGSRAMLFTHSHWQSVLRNYPSLFGPITVGDHVFIGNSAFVFPGVTIGAGATVMVNSFVALNVAPATLVGGVPAQVMRHIVAPARAEQVAIVRERLMPELAALLQERGYAVNNRASNDGVILEIDKDSTVRFVPSWGAAATPPERTRTVVLTFADQAAPALAANATLFDLAASRVCGIQDELSDEVREFCRRRGIRFRPLAWRYGVGHFEGDQFRRRQRAAR